MSSTIDRRRRGPGPFVYLVAAAIASGCAGDGCSCMQPIPGGFPAAERTPNAAQVRVSSTGVAAITSDPQALIEGLTGGPLTFDVPASCDGTPTTCCPGGNPVSPCGPIVIDLAAQPDDEPRLVVTPAQGGSRIDVTLRARVHTAMNVPISALGADCELVIDTAPGDDPDLRVDVAISFVQDAEAGTTRVVVGDPVITQFTGDDYDIEGGFACALVDWGSQFFIDTLTGTFADAIKGAIEDQTCKTCPGGTVEECGPFAAACTDGVCRKADDSCVQELGVSGRMLGALPGTTGGIDLYEVAGGYATTDGGGIALGLLGGMLPAGGEGDRCGPPATAPAPVTIPPSAYFQGNARPDTNAPFDIAIGVHENQLDRFAYSAYDGGMLCLTIGTSTVDLISSGTLGLFIPSLLNLAGPESVPMAVGLRPQSPPTITLGLNTFIDDGAGNLSVDEPLLDLQFSQMEIDFFAAIEDQYVRVFTLVADVHLPVGLQVAGGEIVPVLGDLQGAFTNLSVKNSEALTESPEDLAGIFPTILEVALGQLGSLGGFEVPSLGGLNISVTEITAVDDKAFLAIFGELEPATMAGPPVDTTAAITGLAIPDTDTFATPRRWTAEARPRLGLELGGSEPGLEWQVRVDGGMWSAWSPHPRRTIAPHAFWVQGRHRVEVRARRIGDPGSIDRTPAVIEPVIDTIAPTPVLERGEGWVRITGRDNAARRLRVRWRFGDDDWVTGPVPFTVPVLGRRVEDLAVEVIDEAGLVARAGGASAIAAPAPFHGTPGDAGCGCAASGGGESSAVLALLVALGLSRRVRRRLGAVAIVVGVGAMPACDCGGSPPCGDVACMEGEVTPGPIGKFNGVASDGTRTVVSTYDEILGDLVVVDVGGGEQVRVVVDGVPDETPTYDPSGYRGGIAGPGEDVGAWTAIALHEGRGRVAYHDRTGGTLRFAREEDSGWAVDTIDQTAGAQVGLHTSIALEGDGAPVVAYLATDVAAGDGFVSELRLARAPSPSPQATDWQVTTIATAPSSCAGLCDGGQSCVALDGQPETCVAASGDCAGGCGEDELCVASACVATIPEPAARDLPRGTGLFPTVLVLDDGRLAIVYYDRARTALVLALETAAGASTFEETLLDGADGSDRGMWASAVHAAGTIHVAYQDALADDARYVTWSGGVAGTPEVVDDGVREGDRPHPVGAGAAIFLDGATVEIAYQDGLSADLVLATRAGDAWTIEPIATGPLLDGFHTAATSTGPWLVWDVLDPALTPPTGLLAREQP